MRALTAEVESAPHGALTEEQVQVLRLAKHLEARMKDFELMSSARIALAVASSKLREFVAHTL